MFSFVSVKFFEFFLKTLSKAKYECAKETLSEDASAMIFIHFGLLRNPGCVKIYFAY